jgi:flavin reductase ActVB
MAAPVTQMANEEPLNPAAALAAAPRQAADLDPNQLRFREAMSHLASGVVLVTASLEGRPWGMTVSAACPICIEPPTMLVSLESRTALARAVVETGRFGVNILGERALDVARFGSSVGAPKFLDDGLGVELGDLHPAELMLEEALGHVDCEVVDVIAHGTHTIFLGRVRGTGVRADVPQPLVHFRRTFWKVGKAA